MPPSLEEADWRGEAGGGMAAAVKGCPPEIKPISGGSGKCRLTGDHFPGCGVYAWDRNGVPRGHLPEAEETL